MKKSNAKTSLNITLNPNGGAKIHLKFSDLDSGHPIEATERIMLELIKLDDYRWLSPFVTQTLSEKYCNKCVDRFNMSAGCRDESSSETKPFPYCFEEGVNHNGR